MQSKHIRRLAAAALLAGLTGAAQAHTGHGVATLSQGLAHPFGLDHLLAMVAVGVWSAAALPQRKAWMGPATFLAALTGAAVLGAQGLVLPFGEQAIALSVALFGLLLVASRQQLPMGAGLALVAVSASLHGLAHGAEAPAAGFATYAIGFMLTTAVMHISGMGIGLAVRRWLGERRQTAMAALGGGLGAAGLYLFGQLAA